MLATSESEPSDWVVVLLDDDGAHRRSDAILRIAGGLGPPWSFVARLARLVPRAARNRVYDAVARRRYRWFGKETACRLPGPGEEDVFRR